MSQIVISCPAPPGCCAICGAATKPWFWDTGLTEDCHNSDWSFNLAGAVYVCSDCFIEVAINAWFLPPQKVMELRETSASQQLRIAELEEYNQGLENALESLHHSRRDDLGLSPVQSGPSLDFEMAVEAARQSEARVDAGESESPEPSDEQGLPVVRVHAKSKPTIKDL